VNQSVTYADVILPLALPRPFTYAIPVEWKDFIVPGHRVVVPFKTNKLYTGIVAEVHQRTPSIKPRLIETVADEEPSVTPLQIQFWKWMAEYYMSHIGDVMSAALPSGLKLNSETKFYFNEYYSGDFTQLNDEEFNIVQALRKKTEMSLADVQDLLQKRNVYQSLQKLFNDGIVLSREELKQKYKPRLETFIKLHERFQHEKELEKLYDELQRAPKQVELLLAYTQLSKNTKYIKKNELLKLSKCESSVLKKLIDKKIFAELKIEISRIGLLHEAAVHDFHMSETQQAAFSSVEDHFKEKQTVLLHGVTGSGKTMVYTKAIQKTIEEGKQALFLLPEIALTAQLINRLRKFFGNQIGIYHSKFNLHERVEIWYKVLKGEYRVLLGARSAIFLPFQNLGLVVVDEEHDPSYKQTELPPRYRARDSAIMLAKLHQAKVILGSATPSIESMFNALRGKYGLVEMKQRFGNASLPTLQMVNMKTARKKQEVKGNFSKVLLNEIAEQLKQKKQTILFLNRRGYAEYMQCNTCDYVYMCKHCDVSLTYHKFLHKLICHYCGFQAHPDSKCKNCGSPTLEITGKGTEQIEEEIQQHFPDARVARLDLDTMKTKNAFAQVISAFENREIDILIGTQMVSKGLDFDGVGLVGIIDADRLIYQPGYRSTERAFQLIVQVSGRAGRKDSSGKVIIQTSHPSHPLFSIVQQLDFTSLYESEIAYRKKFLYPPFTRLIQVTLRAKDVKILEQSSLWLAGQFKKSINAHVLGPAIPFISKIKNYYLRELLIKPTVATGSLSLMKNSIREILIELKNTKEFKQIDFSVDVDV
jgi:primosomal protein N' (replication factor Y)